MKSLGKIQAIFFDFDGVFTENSVYISEDGIETVKCSRFDGIGLQKLRDLKIHCAVVSSEQNSVVQKRCEKLKIDCYSGIKDKFLVINKLISQLEIKIENVAFLGNDINDLGILQEVGFPFIVADAHQDVFFPEFYTLSRKGGEGVVRELCDMVSDIKRKIND